jgi:hypothetical protein
MMQPLVAGKQYGCLVVFNGCFYAKKAGFSVKKDRTWGECKNYKYFCERGKHLLDNVAPAHQAVYLQSSIHLIINKMKNYLPLFMIAFFAALAGKAQTTLVAGDIAVIYHLAETNADTTAGDRIGLVLLVDITSGTVFKVTENGSNGTQLDTDEGILTLTATTAHAAGDVINITLNSGGVISLTAGFSFSLSGGGYALSTAGDHTIVYTGTEASPTFIFSAHFNGTSWNTCNAGGTIGGVPPGLCGANQSHQPLTGVTFAFGSSATDEYDNNWYSGPLPFLNRADALAKITDIANWSGNDAPTLAETAASAMEATGNLFGSPCTNPTVPTVMASPTTICAGASSTLTITGTLNNATHWAIYTGACGQTLLGTTATSTFMVSPSSSTTYFVRGEGGCVPAGGACGSATVTVAATAPVITNLTYSPDPVCPGAGNNITLTVTGSLNDATQWVVYNGSCGGMEVLRSSSSVINLGSLTTVGTTTIFVRGEGGCVPAGGACTPLDIMVEETVTALCVAPFNVLLNAMGMATITAEDVDNGSSACTTPTLSINEDTFDCTDIGPNVVTLTVEDQNNNTATCNVTVTVLDNTAPQAICQNIDVYLDANGDATILPAVVDNGSNDNCGVDSLAVTPNVFDCDDIANNPTAVSLRVFDAVGNFASCTAQVTVRDTIKPVFTCQDITVSLNASGIFTIPSANFIRDNIQTNFQDNCTSSSGTFGITVDSWNCSNIGDNATTIFARDDNDNETPCTITVTVTDPLMTCNQAPVAVCQAVTVDADANCEATTVTAEDFDDGSSDADMDPLTFSVSPAGPYALGTTNVTLTVSDGTSISTCMTTVTVNDVTPPTVTCTEFTASFSACPDAINPNSPNGLFLPIVNMANFSVIVGGSLSASFDLTTCVTDNCSGEGFQRTLARSYEENRVPGCSVDIINVVVIRDAAGNQAVDSLFFRSTITYDGDAPMITCPANAFIDCGVVPTVVAADASASSGCGFPMVTVSAPVIVGEPDVIGTTYTYTFTATDGCGQTSFCQQVFTVQDTVAPSIICPATQTVSPDATGNYTLADFTGLASADDDCSASLTVTQMPAAGTTLGLGSHTISLTATDGATNTATCNFTLVVQTRVGGQVVWEHDDSPVPDAIIALSGDDTGTDTTDVNGDYEFITLGGDLTLTPTKNDNPRQGVDAADAARIRQHALGTLLFNDGYKVIAADVNENNAVTNADAVILQQALLGNVGAGNLLDNPSWQFVDSAHVFATPNAPWGFPAAINLMNVAAPVTDANFVGVKMGDVNGTWGAPPALTAQPAIWLVADETLEAGSTQRVSFALGENLNDVAAWQFALRLDPAYATVSRITPKAALPLTREDFGTTNLLDGELRSVFAQAQGQPLKAGEVVFELELTVRQGGVRLSEILTLDNDILDGRVYDTALKGGAVKLAFAPVRDKPGLPTVPTYAEAAFELYQNVPNPFADETIIAFSLPTDAAATITVHDASGRVVAQLSGDYAAGYNTVRLTRDALKGATGILTYTVTAGTYTATRRMLVVE